MNKRNKLRPAYLKVECERTIKESGVMAIVAATEEDGELDDILAEYISDNLETFI